MTWFGVYDRVYFFGMLDCRIIRIEMVLASMSVLFLYQTHHRYWTMIGQIGQPVGSVRFVTPTVSFIRLDEWFGWSDSVDQIAIFLSLNNWPNLLFQARIRGLSVQHGHFRYSASNSQHNLLLRLLPRSRTDSVPQAQPNKQTHQRQDSAPRTQRSGLFVKRHRISTHAVFAKCSCLS